MYIRPHILLLPDFSTSTAQPGCTCQLTQHQQSHVILVVRFRHTLWRSLTQLTIEHGLYIGSSYDENVVSVLLSNSISEHILYKAITSVGNLVHDVHY